MSIAPTASITVSACALLLAMQRWLASGKPPPSSVFPTFAAGTLGSVDAYRERFPKIPSFRLPSTNLQPPKLDLGPRFREEGIVDRQPADLGPSFVTAVPLPDADGIDRGGIRLPGIAMPLATHTGWNLRRPEIGASDKLARWSGSMLPLLSDEASRKAAGDPRPTLKSRYDSRAAFALAIEETANALVDEGFVLAEDVPEVTASALRPFLRLQRAVLLTR